MTVITIKIVVRRRSNIYQDVNNNVIVLGSYETDIFSVITVKAVPSYIDIQRIKPLRQLYV